MARILVAVDSSTPDLADDDRVLADALRARGITVEPVRWGAPVPADAVLVVRSTWDYVERPAEFLAWLDHLDERGATVVNPTPLLRWNHHKRYLLDLHERGVPIVPTELVTRGDDRSLTEIRARRGWHDVIVKPAVGGTARATVHGGRIGGDAAASHLARLIEHEDVLIQPVVDSISTAGEISIVALTGMPRAAVLKVAGDGEWRVQSDFGGTARAVDLTDDLVSVARRALDATAETPLYARIDVADLDGRWVVMELELVEPELFFRLHPALAETFADLLARLARR